MASSEALRAVVQEIRTGEITDAADVGWLIISDGLACLRTVREFLTQKKK